MKKEIEGYIQIVIASFLFGFIPIIVRFGNAIGPYNLSFFRILIAVISLFLFFILFKKFKLAPLKHEKGKLIFFGAIHGFIILGYFLAIQFLSIASAVLLLYSSAIWMVIFSHFILKEKITKLSLVALVVAVVGLLLVVSPKDFFIKESLIGSVSGILAGIGFGLVYVMSKTFKKYDKISLTFWQNLIALPFLLPLIFIDIPRFSLNDVSLLILLGTVFTTLPFILVFKGFAKVKASNGAVFVLLDVIFPILFALLFFGEVPEIRVIIGGCLIILGSYFAARAK
jgi:drug/metabolite transporter (DMT)-like permease